MSDARSLVQRLRRAFAPTLLTAILLAAVAVLGQIPYGGTSESAALRFSLRTVHGKVETCRERSEAELAALPQHMRTPTACTEYTPIYHLEVAVDDRSVLDLEVAPGGWRGDRPLTVDQQLEIAPGPARLVVRFGPRIDDGFSAEERRAAEALPHYELDRETLFVAGRITLVLLDEATESLELYSR